MSTNWESQSIKAVPRLLQWWSSCWIRFGMWYLCSVYVADERNLIWFGLIYYNKTCLLRTLPSGIASFYIKTVFFLLLLLLLSLSIIICTPEKFCQRNMLVLLLLVWLNISNQHAKPNLVFVSKHMASIIEKKKQSCCRKEEKLMNMNSFVAVYHF